MRVSALAGVLMLGAAAPRQASAKPRIASVAVFPVENLSGRPVPADELHRFLTDRLAAAGIAVLPGSTLDGFIARHRVRYAAGIDSTTAVALKQDTGVDAILIASVEFVSQLVPPKVALYARLVSLDSPPAVVWADDAGLSGDDAPGLLDLGLVNDAEKLLVRAIDRLSTSLVAYVASGQPAASRAAASKFGPKVAFNGVRLESGNAYTIAVLPFFNLSDRPNAGEILAGLFIRHLSSRQPFRVLDSGEVRQQLLKARIIMDGGVSLADADLIGSLLDADFILGGRVLYYQDYEGPEAVPKVEFSTVVIERRTRKVVWSSQSYNGGLDGVRFFGRGRSMTAHAMATQMVALSADRIGAGGR
jgi:TolB-like protein